MRTLHIAFTGGGTGGHIFPILAVAEDLRKIAEARGIPVLLYYIGPTRGPIDIDLNLFWAGGIEVRSIAGGALPQSGPNRGMMRFFRTIAGFFQSLWHLYAVMPDIIFSKGGYGAAPVIAAAIFYRIPFFIHESDAIPGRTNVAAARFAKRIAVAFAEAVKYFPAEKTASVGNPIRAMLFEPRDKNAALGEMGLSAARKTIFVVGGSQGARAMNDVILDILPELLKSYQVIHQCGARNFGEVEKEASFVLGGLPREAAQYYKLHGFLAQGLLRDAYEASDIVIARAGSGSIFEIASRAKPSILIPFRYSAQGHQRANAYAYANTGAATVLEEENFTPHILTMQIQKIVEDPEVAQKMMEAARSFARPDASARVAEELLRSLGAAIPENT